MNCLHKEIRIAIERIYIGTLINGQVVFDSRTEDYHEEVTEIYCIDCDEIFDNLVDLADIQEATK